jgi:uncharacterized protein (DUF779 family)
MTMSPVGREQQIKNTDPDLRVDVSPGCAMGFSLDADPTAILAWLARQRIAAQERGRVRCRF